MAIGTPRIVIPWPSWARRKGPLAGEAAALFVLVVVDTVLLLRSGPWQGWLAPLVIEVAPGLGPAAAVLAVLRRRFPERITTLTGAVVGLSLLATVVSVAAGQTIAAQPSGTETLSLALLVGACCRRLPPRMTVLFAVLGGLAMVTAPLCRYGIGSRASLLAIVAALVWGAALAAGLVLRDADNRRRSTIIEVRSGERLRLARELHDLVAHHITGVVVRVQAARRIAERKGEETEPLAEIEQAGAEALAAMRRLVGMLRTEGKDLFDPPSGLMNAVDRAIPDDGSVTLRVPDGLADIAAPSEVVTTVHRLLTEALTNARRHSAATETQVVLELEQGWLVVDVVNDGVRAAPGGTSGYGLIGMAERVTAVGGTVRAGQEHGHRWRVSARLPL